MAALALPAAAEAQVLASNFSQLTLTSGASFNLDIDGNGTNDFRFYDDGGQAFLQPLAGTSLIYQNGSNVIFGLNFGDSISVGSGTSDTGSFGFFTGGSAYAAVTFDRAGSSYAAYLFFDFTGTNAVLQSAAWESTASASLLAGATPVPEPAHVAGGIGLLAGAAALFRRRKTAT